MHFKWKYFLGKSHEISQYLRISSILIGWYSGHMTQNETLRDFRLIWNFWKWWVLTGHFKKSQIEVRCMFWRLRHYLKISLLETFLIWNFVFWRHYLKLLILYLKHLIYLKLFINLKFLVETSYQWWNFVMV